MLQELLIVQFLLCLPVLLCNGSPARKGPEFTKEEESLIIQEMLDFPAISKSLYNANLWRTIAHKHNENLRSETPGFPKERTTETLSTHFRKVMRKSKGKVQIPDILWQKFKVRHYRGKNRGQPSSGPGGKEGNSKAHSSDLGKSRYNAEEDKLIIEEVLKYPVRPISIHRRTMWNDIAAHLQEKRRQNPTQFPNERTATALYKRFLYILNTKLNGEERDNLITEMQRKGPVESEGTREGILRYKFTQEEDDFITEAVFHQLHTSQHNGKMWKEIKEKHDEKRLLKTAGFGSERLANSLRSRFYRILLKEGPTRSDLREKFPEQYSAVQAAARRAAQFQDELTDLQVKENDDTEMWESMIDQLLHTCGL